jgi:sec-independent protein translocase protein TatC
VLLILAKIGVIDAKTLTRYRRYAILLIFIFAAVMTPPDLISQLLMALPLMALYELSILLAKLFGKRSHPTSPGSEAPKEAVSTSPS